MADRMISVSPRARALPTLAAALLAAFATSISPGCFPKLPPEELTDAAADTTVTPPDGVEGPETTADVLSDVAGDAVSDTTEEVVDDVDTSDDADTGPTLNACGGTEPITMDPPGGSCGVCADGLVICDPADPAKIRTRCIDATALNTCGACGVIDPAVGTDCGTCGQLGCTAAGSSATTCVEPSGGCNSNLTCADLTCEAQGRVCVPGVAEEDAGCGACAAGYLEFGEVCLISLGAPTTVTATTNRDADVRITWTAVTGAAGYKVYRCPLTANCSSSANWTRLSGANAITVTSFDDATAASGGVVGAPQDIVGTSDGLTSVTVSWTAIEAPATPVYRFAVTTMSPAGESVRSGEALGSRAVQPISGYEIEVDGAGSWTGVGNGATWTDTTAPAGVITPGAVTATTGLYADRVDVALTGSRADAGTQRRYRVRAVNAAGPGTASIEATGRRTVGSVAIAWEKSTGTTATNFAPVSGVTVAAWSDTNAPVNGDVRWYRARVTASGAVEAISEATSGSRQSAPSAVTNLMASTDRVDEVRLTWTAAPGALGYHVYRDGTKLTSGNVGISSTNYEDRDTATAPAAEWAAPANASATSDDPDKVTVSWTAPTRPVGSNFSYTVRPVNAAGEGAAAGAATGRRVGAVLTGFEVKRAGGAWVAAGGTTATAWTDTTAAAPTVTAGTVTASDATDPNKVFLTVSSVSATNGAAVSYAIRATTAGGPGASTAAVAGRREAGALYLQWQRSAGASADTFSDLAGATTNSYSDTTAPSSGEVRYYRVSASANGATTVYSAADAGSRLPPAGVPGNVQATTDRTGEIRVTWGAVAGATGYKVYRGGVLVSGAAAITATTYDDTSLATAVAGTWAAPTALATTSGPDNVTLSWTAPTRPTGSALEYTVTAINTAGESAQSASASGRRVAPALTRFEVSIDSGAWATTGGTTTDWTDSAAPAGTLTIGTVTASDETYAEYVRITAATSTANGTIRSYRVRAMLADASSSPASTASTSRRVVGAVTYQWERSAGTTSGSFSAVNGFTSNSHDDSGAPANGDIRWYRVRVNAPGVAEALSTPISGRRLRPPEVPGNVSATTQMTTGIEVSWDAAARATAYHVFRGTVQMTTQPITATNWTDSSAATVPDAWAAPTALTATGSFTEIALSWTAPTRPSRSLQYSVRAVNASGQSDLSGEVTGTRLAPALEGYDIERTPSGGQTTIVSATGAGTVWNDANAPSATITPGTITASKGEFRAHVLLSHNVGAIVPASLVSYRVRVRANDGSTTGWSNPESARRASSTTLMREWSYNDHKSGQGPFTPLTNGNSESFEDTTAPKAAPNRFYHLRLSATGAPEVILPNGGVLVSGYRLIPTSVAVGRSHACVGTARGAVWCWGHNAKGQIGLGSVSNTVHLPTLVTNLAVSSRVTVGETDNTCTTSYSDATTFCWGSATSGVITAESFSNGNSFGRGAFFSCAIGDDNLKCWGAQSTGQLGNDAGSTASATPVNVLFEETGAPPSGSLSQLDVGPFHSCASSSSAAMYCWGASGYGQSGRSGRANFLGVWTGSRVPRTTGFCTLNCFLGAATSVSAGNAHSCAVVSGKIFCWGRNQSGQLGNATTTNSTIAVQAGSTSNATFVVAADEFSCGKYNSTPFVRCWGANEAGQLGDGLTDTNRSSPGAVLGFDLVAPEGLDAAEQTACAIKNTDVFCWGAGDLGQLGDAGHTNSDVPVMVQLP